MSDDLRQREDDLVWRVRWGPSWVYVYLLLDEGRYRAEELAGRNLVDRFPALNELSEVDAVLAKREKEWTRQWREAARALRLAPPRGGWSGP